MPPSERFLGWGLADWLGRRSRLEILGIGLALIALIGLIDYSVDHEYATSIFYLVPILLAAWFAGWDFGGLLCLVSALVWFSADLPEHYRDPAAPYWNTTVRLACFVLFTVLIDQLRRELTHARELARIDALTGVANRRAFYEHAAVEIGRMGRSPRPFTVAYIDLDNFKAVNDRLGHSTGDLVLREVGRTLQGNIRAADVVARLGGDEFALLLPETDAEGAVAGLTKLREFLLRAMNQHDWPVTFSIGAVTFRVPPPTVDWLIHGADDLMYAVKQEGKNQVRFEVVESVKA